MISTLPKTTPIGEKRVTLQGLTWVAYQQILNALPETRAARLTYILLSWKLPCLWKIMNLPVN